MKTFLSGFFSVSWMLVAFWVLVSQWLPSWHFLRSDRIAASFLAVYVLQDAIKRWGRQ